MLIAPGDKNNIDLNCCMSPVIMMMVRSRFFMGEMKWRAPPLFKHS